MRALPVFQKIVEVPFPAKQAFFLSRLTKKLDAEMENFNECRKNLLLKYAMKDENGKPIIENDSVRLEQDSALQAAFQQESADLLNAEITLDIEPIPLDWLENATLTPQEMATIETFIKV